MPRRPAAADRSGLLGQFHLFLEMLPTGVLLVDQDGLICGLNLQLEESFGYTREELLGKPVENLIPERLRGGHRAIRASFQAHPERRPMGAGRDLYGQRKDGSQFPVEIGLNPFATGEGNFVLAAVADITARKRAAESERLLVRELHHRIKNLLGVVGVLASHSLRGDCSIEEARTAFGRRLNALARAFDRLAQTGWKSTTLRDLVASELEPFEARNGIEGGDILLNPQATQNFALALHELATNASKYGALSGRDGRVEVRWKLVGAVGSEQLRFEWRERGGPPVAPPMRTGFGTALLKAVFGAARIEFAPEGLIYELQVPLAEIAVAAPHP